MFKLKITSYTKKNIENDFVVKGFTTNWLNGLAKSDVRNRFNIGIIEYESFQDFVLRKWAQYEI